MPKSLQGSKYAFGVHFFKEVFKIGNLPRYTIRKGHS